MRHRYQSTPRFRLSFVNENTLNVIWTMYFSRTRVIVATILILASLGSLLTFIILLTPIRTLLPGYLKEAQRQENMINVMRMDSLLRQAEINEAYISNLRAILTGSPTTDSTDYSMTMRQQLPPDSLISAGKAERGFLNSYNENERFNLTVLTPMAAEGISFIAPVAEGMRASGDNPHTIVIIAPRHKPVMAAAPGTIVDIHPDGPDGNTVIIHHANGFLTKYSGITTLTAATGDKIKEGQVIGLTSDAAGRDATRISIELWHNGVQQPADEYIPIF